MSFSIVPSNLGDTVKETDKDMNNTKSSILPMQMTPKKKYVDEKTETIDFFVKIFRKKSFRWDIHKKSNMLVSHRPQLKQWCTSSKQICVTSFDLLGLNNHATQNKQIHADREYLLQKNSGRHFFSFTEDRVFDLPFKFSFSLPHGLSVSAHVVLNQNR